MIEARNQSYGSQRVRRFSVEHRREMSVEKPRKVCLQTCKHGRRASVLDIIECMPVLLATVTSSTARILLQPLLCPKRREPRGYICVSRIRPHRRCCAWGGWMVDDSIIKGHDQRSPAAETWMRRHGCEDRCRRKNNCSPSSARREVLFNDNLACTSGDGGYLDW